MDFDIIFDVFALAVAITGAVVGLRTYRRSVKTRRAEWLSTLYAKFFEESHYKASRRLLDYGSEHDLRRLYDGLAQGDPERSEPLVDYLNFFEFIAGLWRLEELSYEEICIPFDYYLRLIARRPEILRFVQTQGFENLAALLRQLEPDLAAAA